MDSLRIPAGSSQTLPSNTFARTNYNFTGWNTAANGSGTSYADAASLTTTSAQAGQTITLYAQWEQIPTIMQDITAAQCQKFASDAPLTLTDTRDNNTYTVRYINGTCWMTQNLRIASGTQLTSAGSNLPEGTTYTIPTADLTLGNSYTEGRVHDSGSNTIGYWYNYCAASAGEVCSSSQAQDATQDICPKGWSLPNKDQIDGLGGTTFLSAFAPVTGGYYNDGSPYDTIGGFWWSSTARTSNYQYYLYYNGSSLNTGSYLKNRGFYIRCVRSS